MIFINFPGDRTPDAAWLAKAAKLTEDLKNASDKTARDEIINRNASFWGALKEWLLSFSYDKCWFTEARDTCSSMTVDHFRPKKSARVFDSEQRDGYWWLAFDYLNYRLCGDIVNSRKGICFPLPPGTFTALSHDDCLEDESPLLLDPTNADHVKLLTFFMGVAIPAKFDVASHRRAEVSIDKYNLNDHRQLLEERKIVWEDCETIHKEIEIILIKARRGQTSIKKHTECIKRLDKMGHDSARYAGVVRAYRSHFKSKGAWLLYESYFLQSEYVKYLNRSELNDIIFRSERKYH